MLKPAYAGLFIINLEIKSINSMITSLLEINLSMARLFTDKLKNPLIQNNNTLHLLLLIQPFLINIIKQKRVLLFS